MYLLLFKFLTECFQEHYTKMLCLRVNFSENQHEVFVSTLTCYPDEKYLWCFTLNYLKIHQNSGFK